MPIYKVICISAVALFFTGVYIAITSTVPNLRGNLFTTNSYSEDMLLAVALCLIALVGYAYSDWLEKAAISDGSLFEDGTPIVFNRMHQPCYIPQKGWGFLMFLAGGIVGWALRKWNTAHDPQVFIWPAVALAVLLLIHILDMAFTKRKHLAQITSGRRLLSGEKVATFAGIAKVELEDTYWEKTEWVPLTPELTDKLFFNRFGTHLAQHPPAPTPYRHTSGASGTPA